MKNLLVSLTAATLSLAANISPASAQFLPNFKGMYYAQQIYVPTGANCVSYINNVVRNNKVTYGVINVKKGQHIAIVDRDLSVTQIVNPNGKQSAIGEAYIGGHRANVFTANYSGNYTLLSMTDEGNIATSNYTVCIK